jgi:HAD superfamily hydrolase (TIGR01662 family)
MFPAITHILYDLGGTLLYFDGDWDAVFREATLSAGRAGARFGLDPGRQSALAERLAESLQANYDRREIDLVEQPAVRAFAAALAALGVRTEEPGALEAMLSVFYTVTQDAWIPLPQAEQTLAHLRDAGIHQAILSNAAHDADVQALVDKAALRPHLDFVLTSAALGRRKPDPETFLRAAREWGVEPAAVLMVGDTLAADIKGARDAGMRTVWVRKYSGDAPGGIRADAAIETITDLPELLKK